MKKGSSKIKLMLCIVILVSLITPSLNISADTYQTQEHTCTDSGYQFGNWSFSEHVDNATLDEGWYENNSTVWFPYHYLPETYYDQLVNEGDGVEDWSIEIVGDSNLNGLYHSEFNFTPNVGGTLHGIYIHINDTEISGTSNPDEFDVYVDTGSKDQTIDGTKVKDAWNPTWTTGWKQINFDTNINITAGATYELQFETMGSDNDNDADRLYVGIDTDTSYENMSFYSPDEGFWINYSFIPNIRYNITQDANSVYRFNATASTNSYTIMNDTGCNRTQWLGWVNITYSPEQPEPTGYIYPYLIYAYNNDSDFDCVLFHDDFVTFAHWDGSNFYNLSDQSQLMADPADLQNYMNFNYLETSYLESGSFFKMIYNELSGKIKFKKWSPLMEEPVNWSVERQLDNSTYDTFRSHGIGVWNEEALNATVNWNAINLWQLNYSLNTSDYCNISNDNHSRPHMEFPTMNLSNYTSYSTYISTLLDGNISANEHRDTMKMLTNNMLMESRMYEPYILNASDQNDTIYYYASIYDNMKDYHNQTNDEPTPSWVYDEYLHLHIQMCSDKQIPDGTYDDCMVAIDVDNDRKWESNDRIFWAWDDGDNMSTRYQYNGNTLIEGANYNASIWQSQDTAVGNLHRYTSYMNYVFNIPLAELIKNTTKPINITDTFGLHIITSTAYDETACVWQNWNESTGASYYSEDDWDMALRYFMNGTWLAEMFTPYVNNTALQRWGEGQIVLSEQYNASDEVSYHTVTEKYANVSEILDINQDNLVNYTINVSMVGSGTVDNVKVNETFPSGIEYVGCSLPSDNVTNDGSTYAFNVTDTLSDTVSFNITVNFTANCLDNGTNYTNIAYQYNDQDANSTANDSFIYGSNNAPQVNWTYPTHKDSNTGLLLTNISAGIADGDGDSMNLYFYTNKTDDWNSNWAGIGSNTSISNGSYQCNQTFNNSETFNTGWRWGNTTYYWSVNITDGKVWTNNTYTFTTTSSRYDVTTSGDVITTDIFRVWNYRTGVGKGYYGIYDVNENTDITTSDIFDIWTNRS